MSDLAERTFKCKCGGFQAKLKGDPVVNMFCHCHSCVAASRFIDEKHQGKGTSMLGENNTGCFLVLYKAEAIEFVQPDLKGDDKQEELLGFVHVGEKGQLWRAYAKCCGTQVFGNVTSTFVALNGNCIHESDGSPFQPPHEPTHNMTNHAFEESKEFIPESGYKRLPLSAIPKFLGLMANPFNSAFEAKGILCKDASKAEVVPITWE